MTKKTVNSATLELKESIVKKFDKDARFYIFGSAARNQQTSESDIDVLVITEKGKNYKDKEKLYDIAYDIELKKNVVFGIIVMSPSKWEFLGVLKTPFYLNVSRDAVRI